MRLKIYAGDSDIFSRNKRTLKNAFDNLHNGGILIHNTTKASKDNKRINISYILIKTNERL